MDFHVEQAEGVTVILPKAEYLDASNSKEFRDRAEALFQPGARVLVDLSPVQFIDSSGCGAILTCLKALNKTGGEMKLCAITNPVRALFDLVRMNKIVDIHKTRADALQAFSAVRPN